MSLKCRFCNEELTQSFCDLGMSPLSNANVRPEKANQMEPFYPLHAYVCNSCWLVQLDSFEAPDHIFDDQYTYFSSYSDSWLAHAKSYVKTMSDRWKLDSASHVVEIASNDGYLLQYFVEQGTPVLGIEPTANTAAVAREKNVPTLEKFFGVETANALAAEGKHADLLLGNNVLAHVPDLNDFVGGMKVLLKSDGVITMEFPHLLQQIRNNQFDTIYHEHFSYLSFITVEQIFAAHGLTLFDVDELPTHGGSLRIYGRHAADQSKPVTQAVVALKAKEIEAGLNGADVYSAFAEQVRETKRGLLEFLIEAKRSGKIIVGYGAPAKGNTLLNYCGVRVDFIDYTVDRSPHKQGTLLPGTHIPVLHPDRIAETKPDYILILPWNLKDELIGQLAYAREWGAKFVLPIPQVEVID
ncbi:class I SAM-dependent methyltransferase [Mariprofundus sp. NF]|uniref:class I SAM-dependent methyltransferase n=1 Tax=Mariprofundus sp. NF TaxID=2608716 RepID=UPI0015A07E97|nr:class I SAM-dependent methyltransferase [Mariprofundus sp. NF]NWF37935.1 class I SAM-dependent methyltransferase [Mariprofundus sp. NF]